ncbi:CDP-glycerol glycerophosphotransferase family protein [Virgibacillus sp. FSP13]
MFREWIITVYLAVFQIIFRVFQLLPLQRKTTFVATFGHNCLYTIRALERETNQPFTIVKTPKCDIPFSNITSGKVLDFQSPLQWIESVYHLATSKVIFIDNYLGILAKMNLKPNVMCIQLWHAAGAIKRFGLEDTALKKRSNHAQKRINAVYQRFTHIVVGSDKMVTIFRKSFGNANATIFRCGIPRTDFFFDPIQKRSVTLALSKKYPITNQKKIVLYAPTFRDNEPANFTIPINVEKFCDEFCDEYVLFLRLHPAIKHDFQNKYPGIVYDVSDVTNVNDLLVITDILITDYSSIPFEFSLLQRPMIFFAYDLAKYSQSRGFWTDYSELVPGPIVTNTEDLIRVIQEDKYDMQRIKEFSAQWNQYSTGHSSESLIDTLYTKE